MKIGIYIDVPDLYWGTRNRYNKKLDYGKLYEYVSRMGQIEQAIAYSEQTGGQATPFLRKLNKIGYHTKLRAPMINMTMDIMSATEMGLVIIGSSNPDFVPVIKKIKRQSLLIYTTAAGIPTALKKTCDEFIELPKSLLED